MVPVLSDIVLQFLDPGKYISSACSFLALPALIALRILIRRI